MSDPSQDPSVTPDPVVAPPVSRAENSNLITIRFTHSRLLNRPANRPWSRPSAPPSLLTERERFWLPWVAEDKDASINNNFSFPLQEHIASLEQKIVVELGARIRDEILKDLEFRMRQAGLTIIGNNGSAQLSPGIAQLPVPFLKKSGHRVRNWLKEQKTDNAEHRELIEQYAQVSRATFYATIQGYSSLEIGLLISSLEKLGQAFNNNFDTFAPFLEVFSPIALSAIVPGIISSDVTTHVSAPPSVRQQFDDKADDADYAQVLKALANLSAANNNQAPTKSQAFWILANGTLLLPVALALAVIYYGSKEVAIMRQEQLKSVSEMRQEQLKFYQPMLDQQMKMLQQDQVRYQQLFDNLNLKKAAAATTTAKPPRPTPQRRVTKRPRKVASR